MNPLLAQFISEAREALEGIGEKLMQLESAPDDQELMVQLFRLVHTLKGNSGLFDFPEMIRVLHAGEDLMDAVRNRQVRYSQALADCLLDAMDFVGTLCDYIEQARPMPESAVSDAVALAKNLRQLIVPLAAPADVASADASLPAPRSDLGATISCQQVLLRIPEPVRMAAWHSAQQGKPLHWLNYKPAEECFFQGDDPLHQANLTPELLWGGISAREPWPELATMDTYRCNLEFDLLSAATQAELEQHFRYVPDQITIRPVPPLALALPQGDPNGGPVYEDFVADALGFLDREDFVGLRRAVRSMLELSSSALWLSSALRWAQVVLGCDPVPVSALRALIDSLRTLQAPSWDLLLVPSESATQTDLAVQKAPSVIIAQANEAEENAHTQALANVLEVQREILSLPDDAQWLGGRIKAAVASLTGCLSASGKAPMITALNEVAQIALQQATAKPLSAWLEQVFPLNNPAEIAQVQQPPLLAANHPEALKSTVEDDGAPVTTDTVEADIRFGRRADDASHIKSLKVDQSKIDRLMNLIGEMVVAKNAMPYIANRAETVYGVRELSREIKTQYTVINRISEEMQDAIMQVRMMPVSFVFQRFPRLVRDTSRRLNKEVNLVLEGQETSADKNIIESLGDPLVHIVRNSLDHGFELPEVRIAAGKPAIGTLKINARQESDRVFIEISDDGRGIDPEVIKRKAYEKGLIDEVSIERITDQEAINLVFAAGFSTAEVVSDLSGRGVGMDVVRTAVERVNGTITLESAKGQGTRIRLSLPLSMAVSSVMIIASDGQMFGVPMDLVLETVRIPNKSVRKIKKRLTTVLRGHVVPLISLNSLLDISSPPLTNDEDELAALVVRVGEDTVGLLVDDFHGTADIILKPLGGVLGQLRAYSGSALMGDGSVLMVLNIKELV